jgi:hypothetical protein
MIAMNNEHPDQIHPNVPWIPDMVPKLLPMFHPSIHFEPDSYSPAPESVVSPKEFEEAHFDKFEETLGLARSDVRRADSLLRAVTCTEARSVYEDQVNWGYYLEFLEQLNGIQKIMHDAMNKIQSGINSIENVKFTLELRNEANDSLANDTC